MSMSAGGNEGLFKLAETAAPDEHRIMPAERTYAKSSKTVSVTEAIALMKKRKEDRSQIIQGGLDDTSEKVRVTSGRATDDKTSTESSSAVDDIIEDKVQRTRPKGRKVSLSDIANSIETIGLRCERIQRCIKSISESGKKQEVKEEHHKDPLEEFKSGSHVVTYMLNGMKFSVKCYGMIKDDESHCLVLAFPSNGDSFFTPPLKSTLEIKYDGQDIEGNIFYFGMDFGLGDLGLRFLGFLFDNEDDQEHAENDVVAE